MKCPQQLRNRTTVFHRVTIWSKCMQSDIHWHVQITDRKFYHACTWFPCWNFLLPMIQKILYNGCIFEEKKYLNIMQPFPSIYVLDGICSRLWIEIHRLKTKLLYIATEARQPADICYLCKWGFKFIYYLYHDFWYYLYMTVMVQVYKKQFLPKQFTIIHFSFYPLLLLDHEHPKVCIYKLKMMFVAK